MAIQVKIGKHVPASRASNEYIEVIDALLGAATEDNPQPDATFEVPADRVGPIKRQMREAAHERDVTARLTSETVVEVKKGEEPRIELTYILTERVRNKKDENESAE